MGARTRFSAQSLLREDSEKSGQFQVDPTAARAAGVTNNNLIKQNFQHGKPGQFVIEFPGFSQIVLSPVYDVEAKLAAKFGYTPSFGQYELSETPPEISAVKQDRNTLETPLKNDETAWKARFHEVRELKRKKGGERSKSSKKCGMRNLETVNLI